METSLSAYACPVCLERFADGSTFALHVLSCTTPLTPSTPTATSATNGSCPMCHTVYTPTMAPHEIEFHEYECERVNERPEMDENMGDANGGADGSAGGSASSTPAKTTGTKRARESATGSSSSSSSSSFPAIKLFPSHCAVCELGGRTLLHCSGKCARSFHAGCIDEINDASVTSSSGSSSANGSLLSGASGSAASTATSLLRDKRAQKQWMCGECVRGLHRCVLCGFLGHEAHELIACSIPDCGFFFHPACLREQNHRVQQRLVCPRHTCQSCNAIETDMAVGWHCTKCVTMTHVRCRDGTVTTRGQTPHAASTTDLLDPNFHVCTAHAAPPTTTVRKQQDPVHTALKMRIRPGDVVLLLEYRNLLLPATAKTAAPTAWNQWGVVESVEVLDGEVGGHWPQLLHIVLFADGSTTTVPNRYVLPLCTVQDFTTPLAMLQHCLKMHALCELVARNPIPLPQNEDPVLTATCAAFAHRALALEWSAAACRREVETSLATWRAWAATSRVYDDGKVPVYAKLDTRPQSQVTTWQDDDTPMDGAGDGDGQGPGGGNDRPGRGSTKDSDDEERKDDGSGHDDGDVDMDKSNDESPSTTTTTAAAMECEPREEDVELCVASVLMEVIAAVVIQSKPLAWSDVTKKRVLEDEEPVSATTLIEKKETTDDVVVVEKKESKDGFVQANVLDLLPPPAKKPKMILSTTETTPIRLQLLPTKTTVTTSSHGHFGGDPSTVEKQRRLMPLSRKATLAAELPSVLMDDLEQRVDAFFAAEQSGHDDADVPCVRPAFYRPAPFLYRGGRLTRRVDAISRVLLCQDKRNVKCFVRTMPKATTTPDPQLLLHCPMRTSMACVVVALDLMAVDSFAMLYHMLCDRVMAALPSSTVSDPTRALLVSYCAVDGTQHELYQHPRVKPQPDWLCFCANVCHISAIVVVQN